MLVGEDKLVREGHATASRHRGRYCQGGFWALAIKAEFRSCYHGVSDQGVYCQGVYRQGVCCQGGCRRSGFWVVLLSFEVGQKRINLVSR